MTISSRLFAALRQRDWLSALVDITVVAIGILMALAVDEWRSDQSALARETEVLRHLHDDVVERERILNANLEQRQTWMAEFAEMRRLAFRLPPERTPTLEECNSLYASHLERWPIGGLPALEELIAAGSISTIRDPQIRSAGLQFLAERDEFAISTDRINARAIMLPVEFPGLMRFRLEPNDDPEDLDGLLPQGECDLVAMRDNSGFLVSLQSNFAAQTVALQTVRLELIPKLEALHRAIDSHLALAPH